MASITRAAVAAMVHEALGELAADFSLASEEERAEGDYTYPIDRTLLDLDYADITEADTNPKIRAVLAGTEYHALERLYRNLVHQPTAQQGAGASGMHLSINVETNIRSLRLHLKDSRERYEHELALIGATLSVVLDTSYVLVDANEPMTQALVSSDKGLPWFVEGYHEGW